MNVLRDFISLIQGQTIKAGCKVAIHWTKKMSREPGMAYVCLGRSECLEDLYIVGDLDLEEVRCSSVALEESQKLFKTFQDKEEQQAQQLDSNWIFSYLNVRSLKKHLDDVLRHPLIMSSDLVAFGETWLLPDDNIDIDGFYSHLANFGHGKGVAVLSKEKANNVPFSLASQSHSVVKTNIHGFDVIALYLSQNCDQQAVCNILDDIMDDEYPTVVFGDVNIDFNVNSVFKTFMIEKNFQQLLTKPTSDGGSRIDHLYVSKKLHSMKISFQQNSVYFSDHDIISLFIEK